MDDKFFDTVRDRFEYHQRPIARELEYLGYMAYDYRHKLSPDFVAQVEVAKAALKRMEELIYELEGR